LKDIKRIIIILIPYVYHLYINIILLLINFLILKKNITDSQVYIKFIRMLIFTVVFFLFILLRNDNLRKITGYILIGSSIFGVISLITKYKIHFSVFIQNDFKILILAEINFLIMIILYIIFGIFFLSSKYILDFTTKSD